ncbi:MAG: hypothetical protein AAF399_28400, partial [Bacteroidota bacterium]
VYDFNEDKIVTQDVSLGSTPVQNEVFVNEIYFKNHLFSLPPIDYGQISASGLYIVARDDTSGITIYDFNGNYYPILNSGGVGTKTFLFGHTNAHFDVGFYQVDSSGQDITRECIIAKAVGATINDDGIGNANGDMVAVYWNYRYGETELSWGWETLIDWDSAGTGAYGGGQYSIVPGIQTVLADSIWQSIPYQSDFSYRALVSLKQVPSSATWAPYYGEIVEVSLNHHDLQPRRILHHQIESTSGAIEQPEAWISPDGLKMFFKSKADAPSGQEYLYFVALGKRTRDTTRMSAGSSYRLANREVSPLTMQLFPNPTSTQIWLSMTEETEKSGRLDLIGMDGRRQTIWKGILQPGESEKLSLSGISSGLYLAEWTDPQTNLVRFRQKIVIH